MNKISDGLDRLCKFLAFVCITVLVVIVFAQICRRAFFNTAISWADGLTRYMLVWTTFLGATVGAKNWTHISLTFVIDKLRGKAKHIYKIVLMLGFLFLSVFVVYAGIKVLALVIPQKSDSLPISVAWIYASIPFSYAVMIVHFVTNILNEIYGVATGGFDAEGKEAQTL